MVQLMCNNSNKYLTRVVYICLQNCIKYKIYLWIIFIAKKFQITAICISHNLSIGYPVSMIILSRPMWGARIPASSCNTSVAEFPVLVNRKKIHTQHFLCHLLHFSSWGDSRRNCFLSRKLVVTKFSKIKWVFNN